MKKNNQRGFTIIELIVYLAIASIILVSISYLIIDIISGQTKSVADREVNYNARIIGQVVSRDIRAAAGIGSLTNDTMTLAMPGDDITYTFDAGSSSLTRQIGTATAEVVHGDAVTVTGTFSDLSRFGRSKNVGVELLVSYKNPDNLSDFNATTSLSFSTQLRGIK